MSRIDYTYVTNFYVDHPPPTCSALLLLSTTWCPVPELYCCTSIDNDALPLRRLAYLALPEGASPGGISPGGVTPEGSSPSSAPTPTSAAPRATNGHANHGTVGVTPALTRSRAASLLPVPVATGYGGGRNNNRATLAELFEAGTLQR